MVARHRPCLAPSYELTPVGICCAGTLNILATDLKATRLGTSYRRTVDAHYEILSKYCIHY
jgi:hypothetical protein